MHEIARKTLEIYLAEKRIPTLSDFADTGTYSASKDAIFVTLYLHGKVIASSGRIIPSKENTLYECIDNTLLCLKDPRCSSALTSPEGLWEIRIRVDRFTTDQRRILQSVEDLDTTREGLIFLSQNLWHISVILPHMVHVDTSPWAYFSLACRKISLDEKTLSPSDYVLYGLSTTTYDDFGL